MQCDPICSQYTPCLSTCPIETCDNVMNQAQEQRMCLEDTCVEGCQLKPCPENQIYFNESYSECVPKSTCKPECLKIDGVVYYEGDIIGSDACHTCRCTRGKTICSGTPCTIPAINEKPHQDHDEKCTSGWTVWFNQDVGPIGEMNKPAMKVGDIEPMPTKMFMQTFYGSPTCDLEFIKQIECRTVSTQMAPKTIGEDVECSLERGLLCAGPCHDYEIRVLCDCKDEIEIFTLPPIIPVYKPPKETIKESGSPCNPIVPHVEFPGDCYQFLHCEPDIDGSWKYAVKTCGPSMMFNPSNMICDWPFSVIAIKPLCGELTPVPLLPTLPPIYYPPAVSDGQLLQLTTMPVGPITHSTCDLISSVPHIEFPGDCRKFLHCEPDIDGLTKYAEKICGEGTMFNPITMICDWPQSVIAIKPLCGDAAVVVTTPAPFLLPTLPPFVVPAKCPPGQVWSECATPCGKACHFYGKMLLESGLCVFGSKACIEGCVDALAILTCPNDYLWRDNRACVAKADCTCISRGGDLVKVRIECENSINDGGLMIVLFLIAWRYIP